eukprot:422543_1
MVASKHEKFIVSTSMQELIQQCDNIYQTNQTHPHFREYVYSCPSWITLPSKNGESATIDDDQSITEFEDHGTFFTYLSLLQILIILANVVLWIINNSKYTSIFFVCQLVLTIMILFLGVFSIFWLRRTSYKLVQVSGCCFALYLCGICSYCWFVYTYDDQYFKYKNFWNLLLCFEISGCVMCLIGSFKCGSWLQTHSPFILIIPWFCFYAIVWYLYTYCLFDIIQREKRNLLNYIYDVLISIIYLFSILFWVIFIFAKIYQKKLDDYSLLPRYQTLGDEVNVKPYTNDSKSLLCAIGVIFVFVPWVMNLVLLYKWGMDESIKRMGCLLPLLVGFTGDSFTAVNLVNSHLFGARWFRMGLTADQITAIHIKRLYSTVLFGDIPHLLLQILFLTRFNTLDSFEEDIFTDASFKGINKAVIAALLSTIVSVIFSFWYIIYSQSMGYGRSAKWSKCRTRRNIKVTEPNGDSDAFVYTDDFDTNGLINFLGTKGNTEEWQNPVSLDMMSIHASMVFPLGQTIEHVVDRRPACICLYPPRGGGAPFAWILIDFKQYMIQPTYYTLRNLTPLKYVQTLILMKDGHLRNWMFQASLDGIFWDTLKTHRDDESMKTAGQSFTWKLEETKSYYSMFRILQIYKNSNDTWNMLCGGFEIYGSVFRQHMTLTWDKLSHKDSSDIQIDTIRNSVTNNLAQNPAWQTVKTTEPLIFDNKSGTNEFSILIEEVMSAISKKDPFDWRTFIVGIVSDEFVSYGSALGIGWHKSYGYIGEKGKKCHDNLKSDYGTSWGEKGDCITVLSNIKKKTIEFILNGKSQGVAFYHFDPGPNQNVYGAVSMTGDSKVRLCQLVTPKSNFETKISSSSDNQINFIPQEILTVPSTSPYGWDSNLRACRDEIRSSSLLIHTDGITVVNQLGTHTIASKMIFSSGKHSFEIHIIHDGKGIQSRFKFIVGVVSLSFDFKNSPGLGCPHSWGYNGGTGQKCSGYSDEYIGETGEDYGEGYGDQDRIKCVVDFNKQTIEYFKNDKTQGIAFDNLDTPVRPAVSICGIGTSVRICNVKEHDDVSNVMDIVLKEDKRDENSDNMEELQFYE